MTERFYVTIAIKHDFLMYVHLLGPSGGGVEIHAFQARVFGTSFGSPADVSA